MSFSVQLSASPTSEEWADFLRQVLAHFDCVTGTLHRLDAADQMLKLVASENIPAALLGIVSVIPIGKGIAGVAAERRVPVEMCNLQTDASGVARPEAKQTGVLGNVAVPILSAGVLYGTLGIGKMVSYEFTDAEKEELMAIGEQIALRL
jgi:L-methionine (R)-S-oxide reductase